MIYIITTQKDRKAEEILFDYNNENMDEAEKAKRRKECNSTKSFDKYKRGKEKITPNNYRKNEIKLERLYKLFAIILAFWFVVTITYLVWTG